MKIRKVAVTVSRTINLGNYESKRAEYSLTAEILDDDDYDEAKQVVQEEACKQLDRLLDKILLNAS